MQKNIIISLILSIFWSCAGSNATSMEYRSATTAVRSEKNFEKGEKFALEALDLEVHINEARVAYFLAVEIYRPRKNWEAMDSMLNLAMEKNPTESLERVIRLDDGTILKTIADAVPIYKEEVWRNAFNQTVNLIDAQKFAEALDKINFAKSIIEKADNYITSALINIQLGQDNKYDENYINSAKNDLNKAL